MAITTYANFVDALRDMTVTGIARKYESPPAGTIATADLPASFPMLPSGEETPLTLSGEGRHLMPLMRCEMWYLFSPVAQGQANPNYEDTLGMMDHVAAALRSLDVGKTRPNWTIEVAIYDASADATRPAPYWAVRAVIETRG